MTQLFNDTPEKRDRFRHVYTEKHLRELQLALLDILRQVAKICERNDIPYWLDGGTLLGAVRHDGFIPWDDDIDIAIRKEDLPRFEKIVSQELPPHLFLQTPQSDSLRLPFYKVRNLNSLFVEYSDDFSHSYSKGIFIDIFPMEPWPSLGPKLSHFLAREYSRANSILHAQHYYSLRSFVEFFYFGCRRLLCKGLWAFLSLFTNKKKYYSNLPIHSGYGIRHLKSSIFPTSRIHFEGIEFSAPADCDQYLRDLYGDYHTLPPVEKRRNHAIFFTTELASQDNHHNSMSYEPITRTRT